MGGVKLGATLALLVVFGIDGAKAGADALRLEADVTRAKGLAASNATLGSLGFSLFGRNRESSSSISCSATSSIGGSSINPASRAARTDMPLITAGRVRRCRFRSTIPDFLCFVVSLGKSGKLLPLTEVRSSSPVPSSVSTIVKP